MQRVKCHSPNVNSSKSATFKRTQLKRKTPKIDREKCCTGHRLAQVKRKVDRKFLWVHKDFFFVSVASRVTCIENDNGFVILNKISIAFFLHGAFIQKLPIK